MAIDDFDTSRMRQCMECHRHDFDSGDWQFVGYDDDAELYICPDCVELANYCNDDFVTRSAEQRNDADADTTDADLCDCGEPFPKSGDCKFCGARQRHLS